MVTTGGEQACLAGIDLADVFLPGIAFLLKVIPTVGATVGQAPRQLNRLGMEADFWVMLHKPCKTQDHALFTKAGDCKEDAFGVSIIGHDNIHDLVDASGFIQASINIVHWDWLGQSASWEFGLGNEVLVNEVTSGSGVYHGFG